MWHRLLGSTASHLDSKMTSPPWRLDLKRFSLNICLLSAAPDYVAYLCFANWIVSVPCSQRSSSHRVLACTYILGGSGNLKWCYLVELGNWGGGHVSCPSPTPLSASCPLWDEWPVQKHPPLCSAHWWAQKQQKQGLWAETFEGVSQNELLLFGFLWYLSQKAWQIHSLNTYFICKTGMVAKVSTGLLYILEYLITLGTVSSNRHYARCLPVQQS